MDDRRLKLTVAHRVGATMGRFEQRGIVRTAGTRQKATVWRLA